MFFVNQDAAPEFRFRINFKPLGQFLGAFFLDAASITFGQAIFAPLPSKWNLVPLLPTVHPTRGVPGNFTWKSSIIKDLHLTFSEISHSAPVRLFV
jgi:hypothetical protein